MKGSKRETGNRVSYFSSINQFLYGINSNLNVGFDLWFKSVNVNDRPATSPLQVFKFNDQNSDLAVTCIGPKIKFLPISSIKRLSIQSTFLIPLRNDLENINSEKPFLEIDRYLWLSQIFYDKPIGSDFQLFFQFAPWVSFTRNSFRQNHFIETPTSVFFSWFTTDRLTLYAQNEYWPTHYNDESQKSELFYSWFLQSGLGVKYQLIPGFLEFEGLYSNFWLGSDSKGAGETYNIGLRIIN